MSLPIVAFTGARDNNNCAGLVYSLVQSVLEAGRIVATGCATGVDATVISAATQFQASAQLRIFTAFDPSGKTRLRTSNSLDELHFAQKTGAQIQWNAGQSHVQTYTPVQRLFRRSLALVHYVTATKPITSGSAVVGIVSKLPTKPIPFVGPYEWPSCGSGTWGTLAAANLQDAPVIVFSSYSPNQLPALPGKPGHWQPIGGTSVWHEGLRWITH